MYRQGLGAALALHLNGEVCAQGAAVYLSLHFLCCGHCGISHLGDHIAGL